MRDNYESVQDCAPCWKKTPKKQTIMQTYKESNSVTSAVHVSSVYRLVFIKSVFQRLLVEKVLPRNQTFSVARE